MSIRSLNLLRRHCTSSNSSFFVTTPIYYVNANPHIGHLYSSLIADAAYRWQRLISDVSSGARFKLSTGTDEHGSKIQQAALKSNCTPSEYCSEVSRQYKTLSDRFSIDYTDFVRTTDANHVKSVHKFWNVLRERGKIYSAKYSGWYCVSDESFLTESQLKEQVEGDGRKAIISGESGHPVEWVEEVNYMFPLGSLQDDLKYWIRRNDSQMWEGLEFREAPIRAALEAGSRDENLCRLEIDPAALSGRVDPPMFHFAPPFYDECEISDDVAADAD